VIEIECVKITNHKNKKNYMSKHIVKCLELFNRKIMIQKYIYFTF